MTTDLFIEGKNYISVRRASQETGYAQDYIGQLCRQKKIPAKLVGRTWFVDIESLNKYKDGSLLSVTKETPNKIEKPADLGSTSINYVAEKQVELPKLVGKKYNSFNNLNPHKNPSVLALSLIVTLFVVGNAITSWVDYLGLDLYSIGNNYNSLALVDGLIESAGEVSSTSDGLVVFPNDEDAEEKIESIKNSFSDEVEIFFDEGGESGVIRPVFRTSGDTDDYAFVMVPVKAKK